MKVSNLTNNNGNKVPNQFIIGAEGITRFQSYDSIIIEWSNNKIFLDEYYWDYSVTTGKYRNQVLGEGIKETRKKIKSGEYILTDLNKETLEPIINDLIKTHETNFKGVGQPLRIALTGSKFGPGIYDIIISLGKKEIEKRLGNKVIT